MVFESSMPPGGKISLPSFLPSFRVKLRLPARSSDLAHLESNCFFLLSFILSFIHSFFFFVCVSPTFPFPFPRPAPPPFLSHV